MQCMGKGEADLIMETKGWVGREQWGGTEGISYLSVCPSVLKQIDKGCNGCVWVKIKGCWRRRLSIAVDWPIGMAQSNGQQEPVSLFLLLFPPTLSNIPHIIYTYVTHMIYISHCSHFPVSHESFKSLSEYYSSVCFHGSVTHVFAVILSACHIELWDAA